MRRVREIILRADPRVSEYVKYGTLTFGYEGDLEERFPHLEGTGQSARFMRFADLAEVNTRAAKLTRVIKAWCDLVEPAKPAKESR